MRAYTSEIVGACACGWINGSLDERMTANATVSLRAKKSERVC